MIDPDFGAANSAILGTSPRRALEHEREDFKRDFEREDDNARAAAEFLMPKWGRA